MLASDTNARNTSNIVQHAFGSTAKAQCFHTLWILIDDFWLPLSHPNVYGTNVTACSHPPLKPTSFFPSPPNWTTTYDAFKNVYIQETRTPSPVSAKMDCINVWSNCPFLLFLFSLVLQVTQDNTQFDFVCLFWKLNHIY